MQVAVLGSGSEGNAVVVRHGGTTLLLDAGFSAREICKRLGQIGVAPEDLSGVFVTHEHGDHIRGAGVLGRRLGVPLYMTPETFQSSGLRRRRGGFEPIQPGESVHLGAVTVTAISVSHDAANPVCYTIEATSGEKVAYATDMGFLTELVVERLRDSTALFLESNHDVDMLRNGPYPWSLKQRLLSRHGHLSNQHVGETLDRLLGDRVGRLCLMHLSQVNNHESLALASATGALRHLGVDLELAAARQHEVLAFAEISSAASGNRLSGNPSPPAAPKKYAPLPLFPEEDEARA